MSLNINGNSPTEVVFNNQQCLKVVYNGVTIWEKVTELNIFSNGSSILGTPKNYARKDSSRISMESSKMLDDFSVIT